LIDRGWLVEIEADCVAEPSGTQEP
jgi:hypothetical protein